MTGRKKLLTFVEKQHKGQLVRKTTLPYIHHLKAVAEMADVAPLAYEIGLCHDLLEDTTVTIDPKWRKSFRKKKEAQRLATIDPVAQTVKYADLIYNIDWMSNYDTKHLKKYLAKKESLLEIMNKGNQSLHLKVTQYIELMTSAIAD